jgi:hypothetical protein
LFSSTTPEGQEAELDKLGKLFREWLKGTELNMDTYVAPENEVEYWNNQKESFPPLANLAMFVLDADVHASSCERLFKEFAKQHTKARNRLKPKTVDNLAQVKSHVRRKYPADYSTRSKNRAISPKEHEIIENQTLGIGSDTVGATNVTAIVLDDEHNEEDELEELEDDDGLLWMEAFGQVPDDDPFLYDSDHDDDDDDDDDDYDALNVKVDYKTIAEGRKHLKEWPDIEADQSRKFLDWPQENAAYFKRYKKDLGDKGKMYVRVDKYPLSMLHELCKMLPVGIELPTIMSAYESKH